jgi:hypothetical protein
MLYQSKLSSKIVYFELNPLSQTFFEYKVG